MTRQLHLSSRGAQLALKGALRPPAQIHRGSLWQHLRTPDALNFGMKAQGERK